MSDSLANEQLRIHDEQVSERRSIWDVPWQQISQYYLPEVSNINTQKTEGIAAWTQQIYDTTAINAAQVLRSGQANWLTPSSEPWFQFDPPEALVQSESLGDEATLWFAHATDVAIRELARSNFYGAINTDYLSVGTFGTGCIFSEEGKSQSLNFRALRIGTYVIAENDEGLVDQVGRDFKLSARQVVQMFEKDSIPECVQKAWNAGKLDKKFDFIHRVFPRDESKRLSGKYDAKNKPYASCYICKEDKVVTRVSGYDEMPYLVSRFDKWGTDAPWGYSPAFLTIPEARQLNFVVQYVDALAELKAYPRLLVPDNLAGDVDLRPGGVTVYDSNGKEGALPKEWATAGDYQLALDLMNRKAEAINRAFFVNVFQMLEQLSDKKMTAYEIAQRQAERLEQFRTVFDRRVTEFLTPLLRRVFGILYRKGKFGQPPQELIVGTDKKGVSALALPEINITSRISLALKALQNAGIANTLGLLQGYSEVKPEIFDNYDEDRIARVVAMNYGAPVEILRPMKQVQAMRDARAKQQQAAQAVSLAQGAGKAIKDVSNASPTIQDKLTSQLG